jgi:hypothetical protein
MDGTLLLILDNHVLLYNTKCFKDFMKKSGIAWIIRVMFSQPNFYARMQLKRKRSESRLITKSDKAHANAQNTTDNQYFCLLLNWMPVLHYFVTF